MPDPMKMMKVESNERQDFYILQETAFFHQPITQLLQKINIIALDTVNNCWNWATTPITKICSRNLLRIVIISTILANEFLGLSLISPGLLGIYALYRLAKFLLNHPLIQAILKGLSFLNGQAQNVGELVKQASEQTLQPSSSELGDQWAEEFAGQQTEENRLRAQDESEKMVKEFLEQEEGSKKGPNPALDIHARGSSWVKEFAQEHAEKPAKAPIDAKTLEQVVEFQRENSGLTSEMDQLFEDTLGDMETIESASNSPSSSPIPLKLKQQYEAAWSGAATKTSNPIPMPEIEKLEEVWNSTFPNTSSSATSLVTEFASFNNMERAWNAVSHAPAVSADSLVAEFANFGKVERGLSSLSPALSKNILPIAIGVTAAAGVAYLAWKHLRSSEREEELFETEMDGTDNLGVEAELENEPMPLFM